jgi:hypothetical protein
MNGKGARGKRAARANLQKSQSIGRHHKEFGKSVARKENETRNQNLTPKTRFLDEDDSGYESTKEQKKSAVIGHIEVEELDSDEERRICAEFMLRLR